MDDKQSINCTVGSCMYNNTNTKKCTLKEIIVEPCVDCNNGTPEDESMCGSYECKYDDNYDNH